MVRIASSTSSGWKSYKFSKSMESTNSNIQILVSVFFCSRCWFRVRVRVWVCVQQIANMFRNTVHRAHASFMHTLGKWL